MSYLLEALQKSQKEREHLGPVLPATAVQIEVPDEPRASPWLWIACAALLLNAAVLLYLFLRPATVTPVSSPVTATPATAAPVTTAAPTVTTGAVNASSGHPDLQIRELNNAASWTANDYAPASTGTMSSPVEALYERGVSTAAASAAPLPNAASIQSYVETYSAPGSTDNRGVSETNITSNTGSDVSTEPTPARTDIVNIERLPAAIRSQLPALAMQSHIYSTRANDSFVLLNGASMAPGQSLGNGLRLAEITADGVVLNFQGQKIFMPALSEFKP